MLAPALHTTFPTISRRGLVFCALAAILHLFALSRLELQPAPGRSRSEHTVTVHWREQPDQVAAGAPAARPTAPPARSRSKPPVPRPLQPTDTVAAGAAAAQDQPEAAPAEASLPETPPPPGADTGTATSLRVSPPPPGQMHMQLIRNEPGRHPLYGVAEILWETGDGKYSMQIEASLDLLLTSVNLYRLHSAGSLGGHGIAPVTTSETRRGRSASATHFDQANKSVSFSSSNKALELADGAQDKATVLMQLAGIGRADPAQFYSGREIAIQVAEERDANTFIFVVGGREEIETGLGKLQTWHLVRPPRPGSYSAQLDIWLAPDYAWFPVQIRNTESNGAVTTQTVTELTLK